MNTKESIASLVPQHRLLQLPLNMPISSGWLLQTGDVCVLCVGSEQKYNCKSGCCRAIPYQVTIITVNITVGCYV